MELKKRIQIVLGWLLAITAISGISSSQVLAQAEVMAWGNIHGIRVEGQLMEFNATMCTPNADWSEIRHTAKESHYTDYERDGEYQMITPQLDSLFFIETVHDLDKGVAEVKVEVNSRADSAIGGVFLCMEFPMNEVIHLDKNASKKTGKSLGVELTNRKIKVTAETETEIYTQRTEAENSYQVFFALIDGEVKKGQKAENTFRIEVEGEIDREPVELSIDAENPGELFIGMGGNFRLQNEQVDPKVIDYNLNNMRVAYGRVEMPWWFWQADENKDPITEAESGKLHPRVEAAMKMAQRLHNMGMPVSLAAWFAPDWAIVGERLRGEGPNGERGNPLNQNKIQEIYESIGDYIWYLKKEYGVEAAAFSFNESDLGIDVRQTPEEHRMFIRGLGEHLTERGLATKLYLGDTADANGFEFTYPAKNDPSVHKYLSAVSFHSWRGWADETLRQWRSISDELNIPVIVGEGSTDAAAWRYNDIFDEATFAMHEINLYLRILAITQAKTILQWQLTSDYSLLKGGGVFGNEEEELQPMQRFWNLRQLAATPPNSYHLKIKSNSETVTAAAFGDISRELYTIHLVNNGAERTVTINGIPEAVKEFAVYVTDKEKKMELVKIVEVQNGSATFIAPEWAFTSLYSTPHQPN